MGDLRLRRTRIAINLTTEREGPESGPDYSRWQGREELFEREREDDPDLSLWDDCVRACEEIAL